MTSHSLPYYKKSFDSSFQAFSNSLNELVKTYPLHKEYPNYKIYLDNFETSIEHLKKAQNQILVNRRELQKDNYNLNKSIQSINEKLKKIEKENEYLSKERDSLVNSDLAAQGLYSNKMEMYRINFVQNLLLVTLIFGGLGLFLYKLTKSAPIQFHKKIFQKINNKILGKKIQNPVKVVEKLADQGSSTETKK